MITCGDKSMTDRIKKCVRKALTEMCSPDFAVYVPQLLGDDVVTTVYKQNMADQKATSGGAQLERA